MAYGQNNGNKNNAPQNKGFVRAGQTERSAPTQARPAASQKKDGERTDKAGNTFLITAFKNKGEGYSTTLKEDLLIPAGSKVAIFESTLKGKDGQTEYQVLNVKKMAPRPE